MSATLTTEPVEIQGGPLDGTRLSVVMGKEKFIVGKNVVFDPELIFNEYDNGAIWTPGTEEVEAYFRTDRKTAAGRVVFMRNMDRGAAL